MKRNAIIILLLLICSTLLAQMTIPSPISILSTEASLDLISVELGRGQTRICLSSAQQLVFPQTAYLSDETDQHHPLQRVVAQGDTVILFFDPIPQVTRVFDMILDESHRLMGIHSSLRILHFPSSRPQFDEHAIVADSIRAIISANDLSSLSFLKNPLGSSTPANLSSEETVLTPQRLALYCDYIVWKWHFTPHQAYLLQQSIQRNRTVPASSTSTSHDALVTGGSTSSTSSPPAAHPNKDVLLRTLPRAPKPTRRERKRFSRFEQKMLQEQRNR